MKRRILSFKLIPAIVFYLAIGFSCSDEPNGGNGDGENATEDGYFAVVVRTGSSSNNTRSNTSTETGIPKESKVNEVRFVLYDPINPSNMPVKYAFDYTAFH